MGAIVMVQLIVAAYIYKAWNDENWEHEQRLKDKLKKRWKHRKFRIVLAYPSQVLYNT